MSDLNVLAELERIGWEYSYASDDEIRCICPFHSDNSPSCHINIEKRLFKCQTAGCDAQGDFISFMARIAGQPRGVIIADLSTRYTLLNDKTVQPDLIERYHKAIWGAGPLLKELRNRGVSDDLIRQYRLGVHKNRITIPVKNEAGLFVNIRKYLPGAPGRDKMRNLRGRGQIRLFPIDQLSYDTILVTAGEIKAIVAAAELNKFGIGAICATAGEGNWDHKFNASFRSKRIFTCFDIDEPGQRSVQGVLTALYRVAEWIGNVVLPLDIDQYPHGDINDWHPNPLKPLLDKCEEWSPRKKDLDPNEKPLKLSLGEACSAVHTGKRVQVKAVVAAVARAPYVLPKCVRCVCDKSQNECSLCPVFPEKEGETFHINPESEGLLSMVDAPKGAQREAVMEAIGVPLTCKVCTFEATEHYNAEDVRVSPQLEISSRSVEREMLPAVFIGDQVELNESYDLEGRMHPHPKSQQATLLISGYEPTEDALSTYKPTGISRLNIFKPEAWTRDALAAKLNEVYNDLEANVTRIYQRRDLHLAVDLSYHSPLFIPFDGKTVKGWTEILVVGDSAQGKTDTAIGLSNHYGLGEKVECKNASVAGLLGGLQQIGTKWFVTWGVIPTNDKRLVILEELKGTPVETISKLTDMRSSGIAEIPKIEKRRTHARTRLLVLSNPRGDKPLDSFNYGIDSIKELIGNLEDIRRFDYALLVGSGDIDGSRLNTLMRDRPKLEHKYTSDLCRELILWTWTRHPEHVFFEDASFVLDEATKLTDEFTDAIPLVDKGSMRYKIARLSAALAGRTFSTGDDPETLLVRKCHVEFTCETLRRVYSSKTFGYKDYTDAQKATTELLDPDTVRQFIRDTPWPGDFIQQILHRQEIEIVDLQDWTGWDRQQAQQLLSLLVRKHALTRHKRIYTKTATFIELLKQMIECQDFASRPDYIPDEF